MKSIVATLHSESHYIIILLKLRYFVSYTVKHHSLACHIIPFMTQIDKVNTNANEAINILVRALPGLFGPRALQNTLKDLISIPTTRNRLKSVQESKYKVHLVAKGKAISRLGFPLDSVELILDAYTKQSWSFSVRCTAEDRSYFALEWNNELNFTLGNRTNDTS